MKLWIRRTASALFAIAALSLAAHAGVAHADHTHAAAHKCAVCVTTFDVHAPATVSAAPVALQSDAVAIAAPARTSRLSLSAPSNRGPPAA